MFLSLVSVENIPVNRLQHTVQALKTFEDNFASSLSSQCASRRSSRAAARSYLYLKAREMKMDIRTLTFLFMLSIPVLEVAASFYHAASLQPV